MTLRQLEYLDAVAELGSFSAAARRLHVVQPAVSQQLRKLEAELGGDLLTRTTPVRLTGLGERVARHARGALDELNAIRTVAAAAGKPLTGELALGTMHWLGAIDLPAALARFTAAHPNVHITLVERTTPEMIRAVRSGDLDLTFLSLGDREPPPRGLRVVDLGVEPFVLAGAPGSLPDAGPVHLHVLHDRPFIAFAQGMNLRQTVDAALRRADVEPRTVLESNEPLTVRDLAAQGLGLTALPIGVASAAGSPLATSPLHAPGLRRAIGLAWRANRTPSPSGRALIDLLRDAGK